MVGKVNLEKEIDKCSSVEEAIYYLKARETNQKLTLKSYRRERDRFLGKAEISVSSLVPIIVSIVVSIGMVDVLRGITDEKEKTNR